MSLFNRKSRVPENPLPANLESEIMRLEKNDPKFRKVCKHVRSVMTLFEKGNSYTLSDVAEIVGKDSLSYSPSSVIVKLLVDCGAIRYSGQTTRSREIATQLDREYVLPENARNPGLINLLKYSFAQGKLYRSVACV